jgi:hypothetical protein
MRRCAAWAIFIDLDRSAATQEQSPIPNAPGSQPGKLAAAPLMWAAAALAAPSPAASLHAWQAENQVKTRARPGLHFDQNQSATRRMLKAAEGGAPLG